MNKKSQIMGQIFIFIMAGLMIGVIVLIGYNAFTKTISNSCQIEQMTFKTKLESLVERSNGFGTITKQSLIAPCKYETVCFVDSLQIGTDLSRCGNRIINASSKDGDLKNIFVSDPKKTVPIGYSSMIRLNDSEGCMCITQKSKSFQLTFVGVGQGTYVLDTNALGAHNIQIVDQGITLTE